jgi:hypothetical protein
MFPGTNKKFSAGISIVISGMPPALDAIGIVPKVIA